MKDILSGVLYFLVQSVGHESGAPRGSHTAGTNFTSRNKASAVSGVCVGIPAHKHLSLRHLANQPHASHTSPSAPIKRGLLDGSPFFDASGWDETSFAKRNEVYAYHRSIKT